MATQTFTINRTHATANTLTFSQTFTLPPGVEIQNVTVRKQTDGTAVASSYYTHSYNASTGNITINFTNVPATKKSGSKTIANTGGRLQGNGYKTCFYEGGFETVVPQSVTCEAYITITESAEYKFTVEVSYSTNKAPTITLGTTDARTLYENDTIGVTGTVQDPDAGNVMTVKYTINGGTSRAIHTSISDGSQVPFNRTLTFRQNRLYDGQTAVTGDLQEGAQNTIRVWAEDDQGGRSSDLYRSFQVVPNRPATLTINPISQQDSLIDSDTITVSGNVNDPDGNTVTVEYRLFGETFEQVYSGTGGAYSFDVRLSRLKAGENTITIRAVDSYGATTTRALKVTKSGAVTPLNRSVLTYRINSASGAAQGVLLWIQRDSGDLDVTLEISATAEGEVENWQPMNLYSTAFVEDGIEEDEWTFQADEPKDKILVRLTLERQDTNSTAGVRLISGVLS